MEFAEATPSGMSPMRQKRFWLSLIALCVAVACAAAIVLAIVSATTALAVTTSDEPGPIVKKAEPFQVAAGPSGSGREKALQGVVSDTSCNAKHVSKDRTAAECARVCVRHGARYALISGETVYLLDGNLSEMDHYAGQRAEVVGLLDGDLLMVRSIRVAE
jgi:hypothetical protein